MVEKLRVPRLRPARPSTPEPETPAPETPAPAPHASPTGYRTFSHKLAPGMTAFGGALALAGGLGQWVRATRVTTEGAAAEQVATTWGYADWPGVAIAVLGALALASAVTWLMSLRVIKLLPLIYSAGVIGLVSWQLPLIDQEAARLATDARAEIDFVVFHAGYGWGAWLMLVGAVMLFLGSTAGVLREMDVRRGFLR